MRGPVGMLGRGLRSVGGIGRAKDGDRVFRRSTGNSMGRRAVQTSGAMRVGGAGVIGMGVTGRSSGAQGRPTPRSSGGRQGMF